MSAPFVIFHARKRRSARYGKYSGKVVEVLHTLSDGKQLALCGEQRFSVYPDELTVLAKPIHGSPQNYSYHNDGTLKTGVA